MLYYGTHMTDDEFLSNFRMDRECILQLNRVVENNEVFSNSWGERSTRPSHHGVAQRPRELWQWSISPENRLGYGHFQRCCNECVMRAWSAIQKLQKEFIRWPGKRKGKLSVQGLARHMVVNCVGLIDRMLFPLGFAHSKWGCLFHK